MVRSIFAGVLGWALLAAPAVADPLAPVDDPQRIIVTGKLLSPEKPDVFGTVALDAGVTAYGARWRRVSAADERDPRLAAIMAGVTDLHPLAKLGFVQREVRKRIEWKRDLDGYRVSDYWAQAGETLDRGYGDSEDIAVLKMQLLKASGFQPRDFYLTIGRDAARGADTRLIVRVDGRFYALDDRLDRPQTADEHARFVPVITLGKNRAWLHGRRYGGAARSRPRVIAAR